MTEDQRPHLTVERWPSHDDRALQSNNETGPHTTDLSISPSESNSKLSSLYRDYARTLTARLRKAFGSGPPDPNDITQLAFQKLIERDDLSDIANLEAFLWRTARNLTLTEKRNSDIRSRYDFEVEHLFFAIRGSDCDPERVLKVQQQLEIIDEALRKMPAKRKRAFLLHRVDGLNFAAIGRRMGFSRKMARKHVMRAVIDIEDALSEVRGNESDG